MHVLMISLDTAFLTQAITDSRPRHEAYAEQVGQISMVICNRRSARALAPYRSARLTATPTESRGYLQYLSDGYRLGLRAHEESPVDVMTTQDPFLTAVVGLRLRRRLGVPLIIQVHTSAIDNPYYAREHWTHPLLQRLARWTLRRADAVRVVNEGERQACIRHGVRAERICVAPAPVDVGRFQVVVAREQLDAWRAKLDIGHGAPVVIWVGRPERFKDFPTLLGAFARVHARLPAARLILAGNLDTPAIRNQIAALDLSPAVRLAGPVAHADLPSLYQAADVYMHSSYYEGLGLVMIEAAASGLPVVSTASDGARDIVIDGETGTLVPIGNPDALADAVVDLLVHPTRARSMGERGRQHVARRFDQQKSIAAWVGMWQSVAAGRKPCGPAPSP
ncbi:MAG TPA: glycosyltransferase family 4 protein [Vicinamibacterales bacterium]|jgi:glycosyltransferase involved in cell wall biosynthesis